MVDNKLVQLQTGLQAGVPVASDTLSFEVHHGPGLPTLVIQVAGLRIEGQVERSFLRYLADMFVREADVDEAVDAIVSISTIKMAGGLGG